MTRLLLVLHSDEAFRQKIRKAGARHFQSRTVSSWEELREAMRSAPPAALVVVDPYLGSRDRTLAPELRALLWEFPSATVLVALEVDPGRFRDLHTLGAWGVVDVVTLGEDDTRGALLRRLRGAQGRPLQSLLERSLPPSTSGRARSILMAAAEIVSTGGHARDLARALHLSQRTLLRWCAKADLPPPRRLLAWMRILMAAELLDDPGRTVTSVAHACGYASDNSLRRALSDFLSASPTVLRRQGAFGVASGAFLRELAQARRTVPPPRAQSGIRLVR